MKTRTTLGPFMTLVLTLAAQRADEKLQASHDLQRRVANSHRLARLLAAVRKLDELGDNSSEESAPAENCRQCRYSSGE